MSDWWGEFEFVEDVARRWQIGPLTIWVTRLAKEWQVAWRRTDELDEAIELVDESEPPPSELPRSRFLFAEGSTLHVRARLADRPVVARPVSYRVSPRSERQEVPPLAMIGRSRCRSSSIYPRRARASVSSSRAR